MATSSLSFSARKTLFLGLDGIMHHSRSKLSGLLSRMPVLEEALGTAPVDIVMLSCWGVGNDVEPLKTTFPPSLRSRVVGRTTAAPGSLFKRFKEIQNWLGPVQMPDWRALDIDPLDYPEACTELIPCSPLLGMGSPQVLALKLWIQTPAPLPPDLPHTLGPTTDGPPTPSATAD
jgi:hypothetical protein